MGIRHTRASTEYDQLRSTRDGASACPRVNCPEHEAVTLKPQVPDHNEVFGKQKESVRPHFVIHLCRHKLNISSSSSIKVLRCWSLENATYGSGAGLEIAPLQLFSAGMSNREHLNLHHPSTEAPHHVTITINTLFQGKVLGGAVLIVCNNNILLLATSEGIRPLPSIWTFQTAFWKLHTLSIVYVLLPYSFSCLGLTNLADNQQQGSQVIYQSSRTLVTLQSNHKPISAFISLSVPLQTNLLPTPQLLCSSGTFYHYLMVIGENEAVRL